MFIYLTYTNKSVNTNTNYCPHNKNKFIAKFNLLWEQLRELDDTFTCTVAWFRTKC